MFINLYDKIAIFLSTHTPLMYFTQSLWRDEAFSVLVAQPGGLETIRITAADFNPPLYYLILNLWMKSFGKSEIAIRSLSLLFFLGLLLIIYNFAKSLFKDKWAKITVILAGLSPMLFYYGVEARMYSLYAFTITASMYFFYIKRWKLYLLFTTLALYTHPYSVLIPFTQGLYLILTKKLTLQKIKILVTPFIIYIPWIIVIFKQFQNSKQMWIYPVDVNLISSVLSNLLIGYDGTPAYLWKYMRIISLALFSLYLVALFKKDVLKKYLLFYLWAFIPLIIVLGASLLKPLYVNRYLISVSVAQIFLIVICINSIPSKIIKAVITGFVATVFLFYLFYLPGFIKKVDIRNTFFYINNLSADNDLVIARSPLVFFESLYYSKKPSMVYLYNPDKIVLPGYLGTILIPDEKQTSMLPTYPQRAFMVYEDGNYEFYSSVYKQK